MTYVITQACIGTKDSSCVAVCPVDCIHDGGDQFYINPDECIDCGACESTCPVQAIFQDSAVPTAMQPFLLKNAQLAKKGPVPKAAGNPAAVAAPTTAAPTVSAATAPGAPAAPNPPAATEPSVPQPAPAAPAAAMTQATVAPQATANLVPAKPAPPGAENPTVHAFEEVAKGLQAATAALGAAAKQLADSAKLEGA